MNKLTIARIYLALVALGIVVVLGVLNPVKGVVITLLFGLAWALIVVFEDWDS
jgi:hypothetical protein